MQSKKGRLYENETVDALYAATPPEVLVIPCGYSGSNAIPMGDIAVFTSGGEAHVIELKKRNPGRNKDGSYKKVAAAGADDFAQLDELAASGVSLWFAVKFSHRELLVWEYVPGFPTENIPDVFEARLTASRNLSMRKPAAGDWPSARGGRSDVRVLREELGL